MQTRKRDLRTKNMSKLTSILRSLSLDLAGPVRWQEARSTLFRTAEWHRDPELQKIDQIDVLAVFEEEVRKAEKEANEVRARAAEEKRRRGRKARDEFVVSLPALRFLLDKSHDADFDRFLQTLLEELRAADHITAGVSWKSIYPLIATEPRYLNLLGTQGSSPLDLFWDVVDALDCQAEDDQRVVETVLAERKVRVEETTTFDDFAKSIEGDERVENMAYLSVAVTYEKVSCSSTRAGRLLRWLTTRTPRQIQLHARVIRQNKEERRRAEKKLRLQIDDLRYAYKKLDPPVDLEASYEEVRLSSLLVPSS